QGRITLPAADVTETTLFSAPNGKATAAAGVAAADENSPVRRVRKFVERYRRATRASGGDESRTADRNTSAAAAIPEVQSVVSAVSVAGIGGEASGDDGLIILEPSAAPSADPPASIATNDEIFFID